MISVSRILTLIACVALAATATACGGDDQSTAAADTTASSPGEPPEAAMELTGGRTVLKLDPALKRALDAAHVNLQPTGEATAVAGGIALPISAGRLDIDTPSGTIQHAGGLKFTLLGRTFEADNLLLRPQDGVVTARVNGERVPLFGADIGQPRVIDTSDTVVLPSDVSIGDAAVKSINDALGADVFHGGLHLGRLTASAQHG